MKSLEERCAAFSLLEGWKLDPNLVARASQVDTTFMFEHNGETCETYLLTYYISGRDLGGHQHVATEPGLWT